MERVHGPGWKHRYDGLAEACSKMLNDYAADETISVPLAEMNRLLQDNAALSKENEEMRKYLERAEILK